MWRVRPRIGSLFIDNGCSRWPYREHSSAGTSRRSSLRNSCQRGGAAPRWAPQSAPAGGRASRVVGPYLRYAAAFDDEGLTAAARDVTPRGGAVHPRLHNSSGREGREGYWPSGLATAGDPSCTIAKESATVGDGDRHSVSQQHPLPSTNGAAAGHEPSPQGSPEAAAAAGGMRSCREVHQPSCPGARVAYVRGPADGVASEATTKLAAAASPTAQESAAARRTVQLDDGETVSVRDDLVALRRTLPLQASQALTRLFADSGATSSAYAAAALTSAENCGVRNGKTQGPAKHRRRRQRAADRMEMHRGITHHPCRLQGGCRGQRAHSDMDIQISATSDSSLCAYLHHPAVSCVEELRTGRCALSREGRCPWVHGDLADRRHADVLAESWLLEADPVAREAVIRRLRDGAPHVESILRTFVDVITAVVEEGPAAVREAFRAADTAQSAGRLRCLRESLASLRVGDDAPSWLQMIAAVSDTELPLLLQWSVVRQAVVDAPEWIPEAPPRHMDNASDFEALWSEAENSDAAGQAADGQKPFRATHLKNVERDLCRLWGSILILSPTQGTIGLSPLLTDWVLAEAAGVLQATKEQEEGDTTTAAMLPRAVAALMRGRWSESQGGSGRTRWSSILLLKDSLMLSALIAPSVNSFSHPALSAMIDDDGTALSSKIGAPTCLPSHFLSEVVLACCGSGQDVSQQHHPAVALGGWSGGVFEVQWSAWHAFLLPLCAELLRHGVRTLHACGTGLLRLATLAAADMQALHGAALLTSVGWQPLTDAAMFAPAQAAAHTAATYARHHLAVVAPGCLNSLVNGFLACVLGDAEYLHAWSPTSPVRCILRTPTVESTTDITSLRAWLQKQRRCDYKTRVNFLQGHIAAALMFLSALEALGQDVLQQQSHNSEDFERRREAYRASTTAHPHGYHRREGRQHGSKKHLTNGSYPSRAEEQAVNAIHPMRLLLPHGTPAVSAKNTALLVRLLLEGGQPYRSMRLCVSLARVNRMLRSAMKVPLPEIVSSYTIVHKMSRGAKTNRKCVRRIRVPTWRVRTGMESETKGDEDAEVVRTSGRHCSLKPIGLMFGMDDRVVLEIVRVGLRMGIAGAKLADGVREDCMRGALLDCTPGRCLPTLQDGVMRRYMTRDPLTTLPVQSGVASVLQQIVVGTSTAPPQSPGSALHDASTTGILVYRIRPTAELFEMLFAHAPVDDAARVHRYDHLFQEHLHRCGMPEALLAWQFHWTRRLPRHAVQAMECAWVSAVLGCSLPLVAGIGTWAQVRRDAQVQLAQVEAWTCDHSSGSPTTVTAMTTSHGELTTVTELKSLLSGEVLQEHTTNTDGGGRPRRHPSRRQHHEVVVQQAITRHGTDRRQQSSTLWCVCVATLLGLTADCIGGANTTATLAHRSLLYSFLSALHLRDDFGAAEAVDHTVQLWLLSTLWHNGTSMPMSDNAPHTLLSSAHSPVIHSFRAFMQTQRRLAKALGDALSNRFSSPAWDTLFATSVETETPPLAAASVTHEAWLLLAPLLDHPDVAQLWLRHSLFQPSARLLVWISSRLDPQDGEGLACYGRWLRALPPEAALPVAAQNLLELQGRPPQKRRFLAATSP